MSTQARDQDTLENDSDLHPSDAAIQEAEVENAEDIEEEVIETSELSSLSNIQNSSGSAPLTKSDVEDYLKLISALYKK